MKATCPYALHNNSYTLKNTTYTLKNKTRFIVFLLSISLLLFSLLFARSVYGYTEPTYTTITVHSGDTLWTIAKRHNKQGDIRKYIDKVMALNNLSTSTIYSNMELTVPIFE